MDTTDRTINVLKRISNTSETVLEPKILMEIDMIIEGIETRKLNLFYLLRGKHDTEFQHKTIEILKDSFSKAKQVITQKPEDFLNIGSNNLNSLVKAMMTSRRKNK
jgi:hypothetical protein